MSHVDSVLWVGVIISDMKRSMLAAVKLKYFQKRDVLYAVIISGSVYLFTLLFFVYAFEGLPVNSYLNIFWFLCGTLLRVLAFWQHSVWGFLGGLLGLMSFRSIEEYEMYRNFLGFASYLADVVWWVSVIQVVKGWRRRKTV